MNKLYIRRNTRNILSQTARLNFNYLQRFWPSALIMHPKYYWYNEEGCENVFDNVTLVKTILHACLSRLASEQLSVTILKKLLFGETENNHACKSLLAFFVHQKHRSPEPNIKNCINFCQPSFTNSFLTICS